MGLKQTAKSWRSCPKSDVVENYIGRAEDFVPVSTKQLVDDYRLDYPEQIIQIWIKDME